MSKSFLDRAGLERLVQKIKELVEGSKYTHPTTSGSKHIPSGGSSGQILRWSADGTAAWGADSNTTYSAATSSAAGLMSAADKSKLDGITASADSVSVSRSLTSGTKVGTITINGTGTDLYAPTNTDTTYSAATASAAGLMSASDKSKLDGIAAGANNYTYTLPAATSSVLGGVKTGSNITNSSGTISLTKANVVAALGYTPPTQDTNTDTNTTYDLAASASSANGNVKINLTAGGSGSGTDSVSIKGSGATSVTTDSSGVITISSTDSNTTYSAATSSSAGLMSASDKSKLDGITASADSVSVSRSLTSGTKVGTITINGTGTDLYAPTNTDTTYSEATASSAGLMSASDKSKLDGIAAGANNYTYSLPAATSSVLGGVKTGSNITNSSGTISLTKANVTSALGYTPPTTNSTYTLGSFGITATAAELNYCDGVTGNIQTQLNNKAPSSHTHDYLPLSGGGLTGAVWFDLPYSPLSTVPISNGVATTHGSVLGYRVIYSNSSGTTGTINLGAYDLSIFEFVEIQYMDSGGRSKTVRIYDPDGKSVTIERMVANTSQNTIYLATAMLTLSGTTITQPSVNTAAALFNYSTKSWSQSTANNTLPVTCVLGWV